MTYVPDPTNTAQPDTTVQAGTAAAEFRALKAYLAGTVPPPVASSISAQVAAVVASATSAATTIAAAAAGTSAGFKENVRIRVLTSTTLVASCLNAVLRNASGLGVSVNLIGSIATGTIGIGGTESGAVTASSWLGIYGISSGSSVSGVIGVQGLTATGNTTNGSVTVSGVSSTAGMFVGQVISCAQFPSGAVIHTLGSGTFTVSEQATATQVGASISYMPLPSSTTQMTYPYYCYLGSVRVNGSGNLLATLQYGRSAQYVVGGVNVTNVPQMANGTAGDVSVPTWVGVAVAAFIPPTAQCIDAFVSVVAGSQSAMLAPSSSYGAYNSATNPPPVAAANPSGSATQRAGKKLLLETNSVYWAGGGINTGLFCVGWEDNL